MKRIPGHVLAEEERKRRRIGPQGKEIFLLSSGCWTYAVDSRHAYNEDSTHSHALCVYAGSYESGYRVCKEAAGSYDMLSIILLGFRIEGRERLHGTGLTGFHLVLSRTTIFVY